MPVSHRAQARIEELKAGMEQCKAENEKAQWLVFKESEAMYKEFYEAQLAAMRTKVIIKKIFFFVFYYRQNSANISITVNCNYMHI